ncbi:14321_t:CDS:2 [Entrophospora sp. SA101]|nr:14321_t:CDS:2 [Entrophospora sp. SA101]
MVTAKRKSLKKNNNNAITNDDKNKLIAEEFKSSDSEQSVTTTSPTTTPRTRSRQTPTRTSPRKIRKSTPTPFTYSHSNVFKKHYIENIPIIETTIRFEEDEYDVWRRLDTDEINLHYLLRVRYPTDNDVDEWKRELEKLKKEFSKYNIVEEGWFYGICTFDAASSDGTESINGSNAENIFYNDEPSYREPKGKAVVQTSTTTSESNHSHNKNSLVDRDDDDDGISPSVDIKKKKTQLQSTNRVHHCSVPTDNDVDASSSKDIRDETAETKTLKRKRDDIEIKSSAKRYKGLSYH